MTSFAGLDYYTSPEWDANGDSDDEIFDSEDGIFEPYGPYGDYDDLHSRLCENKADCDICWETSMRKYHEWYW